MAFQTTYSRAPDAAFAGQLGDAGDTRIVSLKNDQGADIPAGVIVSRKAEGTADLPAGATELMAGAVVNSFARNPNDLSGTAAVKDQEQFNCLEEGAIWLLCEEAMAITDDVFVRHASGTGTQLGAIRNDIDSNTARQSKGIRVLRATTGAGPCLCYVSVAADTAGIA